MKMMNGELRRREKRQIEYYEKYGKKGKQDRVK